MPPTEEPVQTTPEQPALHETPTPEAPSPLINAGQQTVGKRAQDVIHTHPDMAFQVRLGSLLAEDPAGTRPEQLAVLLDGVERVIASGIASIELREQVVEMLTRLAGTTEKTRVAAIVATHKEKFAHMRGNDRNLRERSGRLLQLLHQLQPETYQAVIDHAMAEHDREAARARQEKLALFESLKA